MAVSTDEARSLALALPEAVELARATRSPSQLLQHVGTAAFVLEERGLEQEASTLADEQVAVARGSAHYAPWMLPYEFMLSRAALERAAELRDVLSNAPASRWSGLIVACLERDYVLAADLWAEAGSPTWEARYRLHAAEQLAAGGQPGEAEAQAVLAAAFYRSVEAPYFVGRCEMLLAREATG